MAGDNIDQSRKVEISGGTVIASGAGAFSLGDIQGTVANTINQLPDSSDPKQPGIKELLIQLHDAIANSPELDDEDKAEALSQVKTLAEAGKNHSDEGMKKLAKRAVTMLRGIVVALQPTAALVTICKEVLPAIAKFFGF